MLFMRGQPERYNEWAQSGCPGWDYESLLPYFRHLETAAFDDPEQHGNDGPIRITRLQPEDPISKAFLSSCQNNGIPYNDDYNSGDTEGASQLQISASQGRRCGTAQPYIACVRKRRNLDILTHAHATKIVIKNDRARKVLFEHGSEQREVTAEREIILPAGALHSPQLLELSGIGDENATIERERAEDLC